MNLDITDRIIEEYKKDCKMSSRYVPNKYEMYLINRIAQLIIHPENQVRTGDTLLDDYKEESFD